MIGAARIAPGPFEIPEYNFGKVRHFRYSSIAYARQDSDVNLISTVDLMKCIRLFETPGPETRTNRESLR
jgi:hypothetical protein